MRPAAVPPNLVPPALRPGLFLVLGLVLASCAGPEKLPPDADGPTIYARLCQKCHGATGRGDGPQAQWKYLPPADFHTRASRAKSDEELAAIIERGVFLTPMHAYRGTLTEAQIRDVVAYIRQLSAAAQ